MKCQSCNCQVSSEFTFAFSTNCCPKCGKPMMQEDVKTLFLKIDNVMKQNGNDLADLAAWLVSNYEPATKQEEVIQSPVEENVESVTTQFTPTADEEVTEVVEAKPVKPKPIKTSREQKEQQILSPERKNIFAKRAGVDKIKFETLVKDIQGTAISEPMAADEGDHYEGEEAMDFEGNPLSRHEIQSVASLFDVPDTGRMDISELQKLQKLEQLSVTGSIGKIRRST
jgi:hypothetical protein